MEKSLAIKIASIIFYILFGISILLAVMFYINMNEAPMLVYTYILTGIAMGSTLIFTILGMFQSKKSLISSLTVIGIFGVLVLVSYILSSDAMPSFFGVETYKLTGSTLKMIDTSLYMMYILIATSFIGLLYTEIRGAFK